MHAISSYRGNRPTKPQTHIQTNRQDRLQYTALLASAQCNYTRINIQEMKVTKVFYKRDQLSETQERSYLLPAGRDKLRQYDHKH